ncbi:MAG: 1-deoxy-D-xylulose-5-phosphate reductoisomerase, partial [Gaiellaceae bacterium]
MKRIALLGATGSIGRQALEIVAASPELKLCALSSGKTDLSGLAAELGVEHFQSGGDLVPLLEAAGPDLVLNAVVGFAGCRA